MSGVDLTDQFLYSVALEWDEPPVPSDSPITGYNISVLPVDSGRQVPPYPHPSQKWLFVDAHYSVSSWVFSPLV